MNMYDTDTSYEWSTVKQIPETATQLKKQNISKRSFHMLPPQSHPGAPTPSITANTTLSLGSSAFSCVYVEMYQKCLCH